MFKLGRMKCYMWSRNFSSRSVGEQVLRSKFELHVLVSGLNLVCSGVLLVSGYFLFGLLYVRICVFFGFVVCLLSVLFFSEKNGLEAFFFKANTICFHRTA